MVSLQLQTDVRSGLYFKKYKYRAKLKIPGICYSYYTNNLEQFIRKLEGIDKSRNKYRISILNKRWEETIDHVDLDQIGRYFQWKKQHKSGEYTSRIQGNLISFFSDDLSLLQTLSELDPNAELSEAKIEATDVMFFKNEPKYKFRTFFRGKKAPDNFNSDVISFEKSYGHIVKVCPALKRFVNENRFYNYLHNSYFIDYNDESTLTLLYLHFGSMLAKTYRLEKQP